MIHVRQRADAWGRMGPPKSKSGKRDIPLAPLVLNALKQWRIDCPKGELDLVGYDGEVLAFVEVKTRSGDSKEFGTPEDAVTPHKREVLARIARNFMLERRIRNVQSRFDVLAIESRPGRRPLVRLHKDAF